MLARLAQGGRHRSVRRIPDWTGEIRRVGSGLASWPPQQTMTVSGWIKVSDEGTNSPLVARLFFAPLETRDLFLLGGLEEPAKQARKAVFDARYTPVYNAAKATRDAGLEAVHLVVTHYTRISSGEAVKIGAGHYEVLENIDSELEQAIDRLLDQAVVCTKGGIQTILRDLLGLDIGFLFQEDPRFEEGVAGLRGSSEGALGDYLTEVRKTWLSGLLRYRNLHEHEGWTLPRIQYGLRSSTQVGIILPKLDDINVHEWAWRTANRVLLFAENMLVYGMSRNTPLPINVVEIPSQAREPTDVRRFAFTPRGLDPSPSWAIYFRDDMDFLPPPDA